MAPEKKKVLVLPGVNRPDLEPKLDCAHILRSALQENLRDMAIVGRSVAGEIMVFGSQTDADAVIGLLTRGAKYLSEAQQVSENEENS